MAKVLVHVHEALRAEAMSGYVVIGFMGERRTRLCPPITLHTRDYRAFPELA